MTKFSKQEAIDFVLNYLGECLRRNAPDGVLDDWEDDDEPSPSNFQLFDVVVKNEDKAEDEDWHIVVRLQVDSFDVKQGDLDFPEDSVDVTIVADLT